MVNKVETEQAIAVMQAWVEGKPIQQRPVGSDMWFDVSTQTPVWNWRERTYRIKPEPTKVNVVFSSCHKRICTKDTMHAGLRVCDIGTGRYIKEFVEVM